jgi:hypothetical protein
MASYAVSVAENISAADFLFVTTQFNSVVQENINLADAPLGFAWIKIDNTEGTTWTLVDNRQ